MFVFVFFCDVLPLFCVTSLVGSKPSRVANVFVLVVFRRCRLFFTVRVRFSFIMADDHKETPRTRHGPYVPRSLRLAGQVEELQSSLRDSQNAAQQRRQAMFGLLKEMLESREEKGSTTQDRIPTPDLSLFRSVGSFSGQPDEDVIKYISSYETEFKAEDWPIGQYLRGIISKLKGDAAAWHNIEGQCLTDWQDWKEQLLSTFKDSNDGNQWLLEAEDLVHKPGQSPLVYAFLKRRNEA